ncbi:hypothetical protein SAMN04488072_101164 [Lentibacillus halodurans]|uniref:Uncharacterized protein n=1 Tax=Lentibacillus halodurans TaxID=237679 RepID=A0A1I0V4P6_9BACI|nr:hypothetical protein [Lentibacillus halodurans]SFA71027.1 hypothetical protein SAMN04488072_101164 [Lentibacillus halodurans]
MTKRWFILIMIPLVSTGLLIYLWQTDSAPVITYFPEDQEISFAEASTMLEMVSEKTRDSYEMIWVSKSVSERELYLRQDASLLFNNGRLLGIRSKWKENTDTIQMKEKMDGEDSNFFQAISIHHGEVHYPDDKIKSIHHMTSDQLYVIDSPNTTLESFKTPETDYEQEWSQLLDHTTEQQLLYHWKQLMRHFNIDEESYESVPLTNLYKYNTEPLPSFTQKQTNQIIGQLWEGIYRHYVMNVKNTENSSVNSYIPLVLFDKQHRHLIVLYEWNGQKERLIQQYPDFSQQKKTTNSPF